MKVSLETRRLSGFRPPDRTEAPVRFALPYYKSERGQYVHRLRYGTAHYWSGVFKWISYSMWCGSLGWSTRGHLYAEIPEGQLLCATCEGRAIGAGLDGARTINGRPVIYSPRRKTT